MLSFILDLYSVSIFICLCYLGIESVINKNKEKKLTFDNKDLYFYIIFAFTPVLNSFISIVGFKKFVLNQYIYLLNLIKKR